MFKFYYFKAVWLFSALTIALSIGVSSGFNIGASVVLLLSLCSVFVEKKTNHIEKEDFILIVGFCLYFFSAVFSVYSDLWSLRQLDKPSYYILAIPVLLILLDNVNHKEWLWYGVIASTFLGLPVAIYERFILGLDRANGFEHPIMFGNIGLMLGFLSIVSAIYFYVKKNILWTVLSFSGAGFGMAISIMSGTRGGWVAVPIILLFLLWEVRGLLSKRKIIIILTSVSLLFFLAISLPQTGIQKRITQAVNNIESYSLGHVYSPVGLRFEMWKAAFYMFEKAPIFGVGKSEFKEIKVQLAREGLISNRAVAYSHSHNEFIDVLAKKGIFGTFFLLLVYLIPLILFMSKVKKYSMNWKVKSYALAGVLVPLCYIDFSLTQVMFHHRIGVIMYVCLVVYFWAAVRWAEREEFPGSA